MKHIPEGTTTHHGEGELLGTTVRELRDRLGSDTDFAMIVVPGEEPFMLTLTLGGGVANMLALLAAAGVISRESLEATLGGDATPMQS